MEDCIDAVWDEVVDEREVFGVGAERAEPPCAEEFVEGAIGGCVVALQERAFVRVAVAGVGVLAGVEVVFEFCGDRVGVATVVGACNAVETLSSEVIA